MEIVKILENMVKDAFKESEVKIVLFGSRARGDYAKTSDIDIVRDATIQRFEYTLKIFWKQVKSIYDKIGDYCELQGTIFNCKHGHDA